MTDVKQNLVRSLMKSLDDVPNPMLEAAALCLRKNKDYNSEVGRKAYFPFGLKSYVHMLHTKTMRLVNLTASGAEPNNESLRDTCLDLINYATFLVEAIDTGEIK